MENNTALAIGEAELCLTGGITDQPLFRRDYFVERVEDPANLAIRSAGMRTRAVPAA